jgi:DNA-binding MarR family transcriptional regulator
MPSDPEYIEKIRGFNRFYTDLIGLLDQHFLDSPFSLTEGRVLYEINHIEDCSAKKIRASITIDEGYLSRIIDRFSSRGLIRKTASPEDGRLYIIAPTEKGQKEFSKLNENSNALISQRIAKLSRNERTELVGLMERIHELLGPDRLA